ncbi:putative polypeptide N-acetylgalactosaminyltransferase 9 [Anopheles ziemanni]|uniref:putative polypeptide N-acetylgalactosaminyltransferase 9 n=1 Tax=Anopheles coustani TaxID=139045 RepID=UPI002658C57A|nr:putative polypeptide N-acetylgalactosaminyltransferase 9 [Anopheles coustani]XP_058170629.1 putative polypeptide N-acetylgalactosaminyltransferase 9 [Anopheles ziemanni]
MPRRCTTRKLLSVASYLILFAVACIVYKNCLLNLKHHSIPHPDNGARPTHEFNITKAGELPGDMGRPVIMDLNDTSVQELVQAGLKTFGYNEYASDLMSVRRRLPDVRAPWCRVQEGKSESSLPPTSIVMVFHNEAWSVLLRSVHSILDRTPAHLIREILLVDDFSTAPCLKTRLDDYFKDFPKVRILRAPRRLGLIAAKVFGGKASSEKIITFLDAHVECTVGWLEPLLREVAANENTIAIPTIDQIDPMSMELQTDFAPRVVGAFRWDLNFGWWGRAAMMKRYANPYVPFDTPAMAGGLFTIGRAFFERLGWYDEGFDIYGIENIELSMKSWMCGGRMVIVPCSRVAHVWKRTHPYLDRVNVDVILRNSMRLAEVWMDEYRQVIFDVYGVPRYFEDLFGSVDERKAVRKRAQCGTFRNYILQNFPEITNPLVPGAFRGEVRNAALSPDLCLTRSFATKTLSMAPCDGLKQQQFWTHNFYHELNNYSTCIEPKRLPIPHRYRAELARCNRVEKPGSQRWSYLLSSEQIRSESVGQCLAVDSSRSITIEPCDSMSSNQRWSITLVELDDTIFRYN